MQELLFVQHIFMQIVCILFCVCVLSLLMNRSRLFLHIWMITIELFNLICTILTEIVIVERPMFITDYLQYVVRNNRIN